MRLRILMTALLAGSLGLGLLGCGGDADEPEGTTDTERETEMRDPAEPNMQQPEEPNMQPREDGDLGTPIEDTPGGGQQEPNMEPQNGDTEMGRPMEAFEDDDQEPNATQ